MNRSDEDLLRAARRDAGAFAVLYDRHAPALARWLERRSNPDVAQELLAETFAQAWIARRRYKAGRGPVRAWLFGIAQHLLFGYYRRLDVEDRARRRLGVSLEAYVVEDADERLDAAALGPELSRALDALPPATSRAVLLRVVEQLDYAEIAARLGCSSQAARLKVSRGLRALRREHGGNSILPTTEGELS
jgi:RNA polymerase sigma-70 factor, ECF subfamily